MCSLFKALNQHLHHRNYYYYYFFCSSTLPHYCSSFYYHHVSSSASASPSLGSFRGHLCSCRFHSSSSSRTFMEVVKSVSERGSVAGDSIAVRADGNSYTYKQLVSSAMKIADLLRNSGLKMVNAVGGQSHLDGARVGIVAKPSIEFVASVLATWFSGGVAVPLALSYPETELLHVMNDSEISLVLSTEDHQDMMQNVSSKCAAQFYIIPSPSISLPPDHRQVQEVVEERGDDPALIVYTSGTTGKPKGVVHTHKSINAQVQMLTETWGYTSADQFLHCLPLHHVHGLFNGLFAPIFAGSAVEFMLKFSVRGIWQRWRECYPTEGSKTDDAITVFTGVPTIYTRLIQGYEAMDPDLQEASASAARQLRLMMCGSSALPLPVMQQWEAITGHRLLERYGMTEFVMAISNPLKGERKAGTVGKPLPGVQVIIAEDVNDKQQSGVGELCVKSPSLFKEYWKLPQVTKESFTPDGFFKTGDAGRVDDDGYYIILGRTSADIMKVGGYKLSALEIESVILEHPAVAECCVLGLPDNDYGDAVSAIIVPEIEVKRKREQESRPAMSLEELSDWAKDKLAPYKLPTRLFLWDSLPRNAMGKVNKKELKKILVNQH